MNPTITYHIGDVHGRLDLLEALVGRVLAESESKGRDPVFSFLGDIVDRGPRSMECMEKVYGLLTEYPGSVLHLGNHDEWFLEAIESDGRFGDVESWVMHGGIQTIESYTPDLFDHASFAVIRREHPHHVEMLKQARRYTRQGPFLAVHAGIDPTLGLDDQKPSAFNWIRGPFLEYVGLDLGPVVHGHTIVGRMPVVTENRVSLDTGAVHYGRLTCMAVDGERREIEFFQACGPDTAKVDPVLLDRGHGTVMDRMPDIFAAHHSEATP